MNGVQTMDQRVTALEEEGASTRADLLVLAGRVEASTAASAAATAAMDATRLTMEALLARETKREADAARQSQTDEEQASQIAELKKASETTSAAIVKLARENGRVEASTSTLAAVAAALPEDSKLRRWLPTVVLVLLAVLERLATGGR